MSQNQQTSEPKKDDSPIIVWEKNIEHTQEETTGSKIISIESYRRQNSSRNESEATVSVREFQTAHGEEPIRLIMVSSGFGQKASENSYTIQSKSA